MSKKLALASLNGVDLASHLFFQARNLAIEALMLRLENRLLRQGYTAKCVWSESSFGGPFLYIRMDNPNRKEGSWEYGECTVHLVRDTIPSPSNLSPCFYSIASFSSDEYWRGKQPKLLLDFRQTVKALYQSGDLAIEIAKINYPFDYQSLSSF